MVGSCETHRSYGLGATSLILGTVGLLLFFLPILGLPISAAGLVFGLLGLLISMLGGPAGLRRSVLGTVLCSVALAANVAIAYAPQGFVPQPLPRVQQPVSARPYVPPPARPGR